MREPHLRSSNLNFFSPTIGVRFTGWRENAIQQSEEMPRVRACDEEERADRQGRPAVEMPGLPVELDDAAAAAQAGADAGGVPFLAAGAVIPKGGGLRGRRPRPAQTNRMVLAHPPAHRPAGRQAPHGHGGRHVHGPRLVPDHRHRRANRRGAGLAVVRARVQGRIPDPVLPASRAGRAHLYFVKSVFRVGGGAVFLDCDPRRRRPWRSTRGNSGNARSSCM